MIVVAVIFWQDIVANVKPVFGNDAADRKKYVKVWLFVLVGSIPAAIFGLTAKETIESFFTSSKLVSVLLIINGLMLLLPKLFKKVPTGELLNIGFLRAFVVGIAQAFAICPGISRSGSTITAGLLSGIKAGEAANFRFSSFCLRLVERLCCNCRTL